MLQLNAGLLVVIAGKAADTIAHIRAVELSDTLQSNGLVESGMIRGGRSATQWKSQFVGAVARRVAIKQEIESINPNRRAERKS